LIADFKDEESKSIRIQPRMWGKGLTRLGCDVQRFSYRNIMMQASWLPCKKFAKRFAKQKTDYLLIEHLKSFHPDIVLIIGFKYLDEKTVLKARQAAPNAIFVSREEDPNPEKYPHRTALAKETDILISTSAGRFLKTYKDAGIKMCAFIPNMCDPDIQYRHTVDEKWRTDIIFTGKIEHTRLYRNDLRYRIVKKLSKMQNAKVYGASGIPIVDGIDYFYAISGAKIGLSINIVNDVQLYHSDRLTNYISCGTFTLAKRVPDSDLLFKDKTHLRYFDTTDEFFELADWYLKHDDEREKIAQAGMEHTHKEFNCTKIAGYLLDLIEKGTYNASWQCIL
jgi:glycosyltransferase involved in cell wall biosynthesis